MEAGVKLALRELAGLDGAQSRPRPSAKKVILFLTDGKPSLPFGLSNKEDPEDIEAVRALYDGTVRSLDDLLASILDLLIKEGISSNTIVVITSDHGENLFEAGWDISHGDHFQSDRTLRIPLVIRDGRKRYGGLRVDDFVTLQDIMPTVLDMAGVQIPAGLDGHSYLPLIEGKGKPPRDGVFAETGIWFAPLVGNYFI